MDEAQEIVVEEEIVPKTDFLNVFNWSLYDLANTIYSMGVVSLTIVIWAELVGMMYNNMTFGMAHFAVSFALSFSTLLAALLMPFVGKFSDEAGNRKRYVVIFTIIIYVFIILLALTTNIFLGLTFFVIANLSYQLSLVFYDAMIPYIASKVDIGKVSGFGVAFGYLGSFIAISLNFLTLKLVAEPSDPTKIADGVLPISSATLGNIPTMFVLVVITYAILAIPFLFVYEHVRPSKITMREAFVKAKNELVQTFRDIWAYRDMRIFIIAWFLVADSANTVIYYMIDITTNGYGMSKSEGSMVLFAGVISAILFTYFVGLFADKFGPKKTAYLVAALWFSAGFAAFLAKLQLGTVVLPTSLLYLMSLFAGVALGGTWVVQRQFVVELAPKGKFGEYFGFSKFAGKLSSAIGPLIFSGILSFVLTKTDNDYLLAYKAAIGMIMLVFLIGFILIGFIKDPHEEYLARK